MHVKSFFLSLISSVADIGPYQDREVAHDLGLLPDISLSCHSVSTGSAEEGAAEGAATSHWAEPPIPAPLHRVSGTARYPEGQVAYPGLPWLQHGQGHTLATNRCPGPAPSWLGCRGRRRHWQEMCCPAPALAQIPGQTCPASWA